MSEEIEESTTFRDVSRCFVEALRRSMRVAAEDDDGALDALSQTQLAERAGMGRSTLAKYLGGRSDETPANPDLDIICRLAEAVGVPPAILLMRPQDWASLGSGMLTFQQAIRDSAFTALAAELQGMIRLLLSASRKPPCALADCSIPSKTNGTPRFLRRCGISDTRQKCPYRRPPHRFLSELTASPPLIYLRC